MSRRAGGTPPEPFTARIDGLDYDGRGVARVDGKVTFVDDALPGEEVRAVRVRRRRSWDAARAVEVLRPSPQRVEPRCPYFGTCGGCALQHLGHHHQVEHKQAVLLESLSRIGGLEPETVLAPITAAPWHYRRRARLGVRLVPKKGGVLVGFRERRKSFVTPIRSCDILAPRAARLLPALSPLIAGLSRADRIPQVEVAEGDTQLALVFRHLEPLTGDDRRRLADFAREHAVQVFVQPGGVETVEPLAPARPPPLEYRLEEQDLEIRFAPTDFVQVNAEVNRRLVSRVLSLLDPGGGEAVLDLFCGLGNITLALTRRASRVTGVEGDAALVRRARENAIHNGIDNAGFVCADLEDARQWLQHAAGHGLVVLDPPRTGAIGFARHAGELEARRIVYVSCNPATFARDAGMLVNAGGFRLRAAGVADMFPHTAHVEAVALFERAG